MNLKLSILMLLLMSVFAGCETVGTAFDSVFNAGDAASKQQVEPDVVAEYFDGPKVRPGITLAISVTAAGSAAFESKPYLVDPEGKILMPLIGAVKCNKLSLMEMSAKVTELYREYLQEPQVTVNFLYHAGEGMLSPWGDIKVLGEVNRPGPVDMPATQDLTVMRVLQLAGGTTSLADNTRVQVAHCNKDGSITKTRVNLVEIGKQGLAHMDIKLSAGDVVWVPMSLY